MTTGIYEVFEEKVKGRCCELSANAELPVTLPELRDQDIKRRLASQIRKQIDDAKCFYTSEFIYESPKGFIAALPRRLDFKDDIMERFRVSQNDPRVQLRGQLGLRATTDIPPHTVLGIYRGLMLPMIVTDENLLHNPYLGWEGSKEEWSSSVSKYLLGFLLTVKNRHTNAIHEVAIDVSAFGYENPSSYINDPRVNPYQTKPIPYVCDFHRLPFHEEETGHRRDEWEGSKLQLDEAEDESYEVVAKANVILAKAFVCNFPFPFLVTTRLIRAGQELLLDYGREHFRKDGRHSINTHQD